MNKKIIYIVTFFFLVLSISAVTLDELEKKIETESALLAKDPGNMDLNYSIGLAYHDLSAFFKKDTAKQAIEYLERVYKKNNSGRALVYLGSAFTLVARDTNNPIEKIDSVDKGIRYINQAVEENPDSIIVRFVRINNFFDLPDSFELLDVVDNDLSVLFKRYQKSPEDFDELDPANLFYFKARVLIKQKSIRKAYQYAKEGAKIVIDPDLKESINKIIKELEG